MQDDLNRYFEDKKAIINPYREAEQWRAMINNVIDNRIENLRQSMSGKLMRHLNYFLNIPISDEELFTQQNFLDSLMNSTDPINIEIARNALFGMLMHKLKEKVIEELKKDNLIIKEGE